MAEQEVRHPDGRIEHPQVRHERTDARFRPILIILIAALVLAVLIHVAVYAFFRRYEDYQARVKKSPYPLAPGPEAPPPPEPRLEQVDRLRGVQRPNVYERQASREAVLNTYGRTDESGFVHIPIGRAMELVEKRRLPVRQDARPVALMAAAEAGLLASPGPAPLLGAAALFPGRERLGRGVFRRRDAGLVDAGESNSGRLFRKGP